MAEETIDRLEQFALAGAKIDREKGELHDVLIVGMESRTDGAKYTPESHKAAAPRFEQLTVGVDHNFGGKPMAVADAWGTLHEPYVAADGVRAQRLTYLKTHPRTEQILEDAERGTGIYSLSVEARAFQQGANIMRYEPKRVDVVVKGATTRTLFNQDSDLVPKADFDALKMRFEQAERTIAELDKRLRLKEAMTPASPPADKPPPPPSAFDPKAFWKE